MLHVSSLAVPVFMATGYGMTLWLIKRWFAQLDKRLDEQEKRHYQYREDSIREFANRKDTKEHISGLFNRVENLRVEVAGLPIVK